MQFRDARKIGKTARDMHDDVVFVVSESESAMQQAHSTTVVVSMLSPVLYVG